MSFFCTAVAVKMEAKNLAFKVNNAGRNLYRLSDYWTNIISN